MYDLIGEEIWIRKRNGLDWIGDVNEYRMNGYVVFAMRAMRCYGLAMLLITVNIRVCRLYSLFC